MQGTIRECAHCREPRETVARSLCMRCYIALKKSGELEKFPKTKYGLPEDKLPVRPKWEYAPPDELEALQALSEKLEAEKAAKSLAALNDLKQRLMLTSLSVEEKKQILAMSTAEEIEQFVAALPPIARKPAMTPEEARIKALIAQLNQF